MSISKYVKHEMQVENVNVKAQKPKSNIWELNFVLLLVL